jgi:hypothetical protein
MKGAGRGTRFCDETDFGFGWIVDELIGRTSHALVANGRVWLIDPVASDDAERRVRESGEPQGVIQLLSRHDRDCAEWAQRLGVAHYRIPFDAIEGAPFEFLPIVRRRWWREVALWWPEPRVLVCADALGTVSYFVAPGERLGVHPLLRPFPPRQLARVAPRHVLSGHGEGVHGDEAPRALDEARRTARRRLPRAWLGVLRSG